MIKNGETDYNKTNESLNGGEEAVITGIGIMAPMADSLTQALEIIKSGKSVLKKLEKHDYSAMPLEYGGEISKEALDAHNLDPIKYKGFQNYIQYGVIAAGKALADAGLTDAESGRWTCGLYDETRRGAFVSTGVNGNNAEALFEAFSFSAAPNGTLDLSAFASEGVGHIHPKWILTALSNNLIFFVTSQYSLKGDNNNVTFTSAGGAYMLSAAINSLKEGGCDMAVVLGADSILNWQAIDELGKLGILNDRRLSGAASSMPAFSRDARGSLPSEGGAALVIELKKNAVKRGAKVYAAVKGCSQYCEASQSPAPLETGEGFAEVFTRLYRSAAIGPEDRVLVNLNASAIPQWDAAELNGLKKSLASISPAALNNIIPCALKPYFGHLFSASFVFETALAAAAMKEGSPCPMPHAVSDKEPGGFFSREFPEGGCGKALIFTCCTGGSYAGVALEKL
ncbi:MAG: 3-oxoacyl-(acyl-carrier-protein) synthase 2 [bacterium ADurb.Bin243]|nr:MAG: 3-oxoacyl-(acyl-carrier-protein) synthase 2 [bacterium ADurb.Bin243]